MYRRVGLNVFSLSQRTSNATSAGEVQGIARDSIGFDNDHAVTSTESSNHTNNNHIGGNDPSTALLHQSKHLSFIAAVSEYDTFNDMLLN